MSKRPTFYDVSDTPVGGLFQGDDGNALQKGQLALTRGLQSNRRPDIADSTERVIGRWYSTEIDVVGTFAGDNQGSIAVGQGYLLLTDRFLRGTVTGSGSKNRLLISNKDSYRLRSFSGTYAFLFDLVTDVAEFDAHSKAAGFSNQNSGIVVVDPYVADENWKHKIFALPGKRTTEFAVALLETIIQAKKLYGDEQTSRDVGVVADSNWRDRLVGSGRTSLVLEFRTSTSG